MSSSRFFAAAPAAAAAAAETQERPVLAALRTRRLQKRKRAAAAEAEAEGDARQLTEMEKQVVALRRANADTLLLFECGYRMRIFADDAEHAAAVLGIRATQYKNFVEASVPTHRALFHSRRLVRAGFKVGIVRQVDSAAARAAAQSSTDQRKPLERRVTDVYTRATIPADDGDSGDDCGADAAHELESDGSVGAARFIMCIVEATVHAKKLFVQTVHTMDEAAKQHHGATETVSIGVLAHDIHTGETNFAQFDDDAKRLRLKRVLNSIEPIEFVLPRGGLSSYSERVIEDFTSGRQGSREENAATGAYSGRGRPPMSVIRIERLDDSAFGTEESCRTRVVSSGIAELSRLHPLCMRCYCGIHAFLSSLSLERTLVSPRYTDVRHVVDASISQFCLPPETQRDLDLFVNSTTQTYDGSLYSILNHTKTEFGARRLRGWIQNPLVSLPELKERQEAVLFLAGGRSIDRDLHFVDAHEELVALLPGAKSLLRSLQRIHVGKATPSVVVNALNALVNVEQELTALTGSLRAATTSSASLGRGSEARLVLSLLNTYPLVAARASQCLAQIDAGSSAKSCNVEDTILRWMFRDETNKKRYQALNSELGEIQRCYDAELQRTQEALEDSSIRFKTHRGGSVRDIHHLVEVNRDRLPSVPSDWLVVNSTKKVVRFHTREIVRLHLREDFALQQKEQLVRAAWCSFVSHVDGELYASAMGCVDVLATLDALCSLATVGRQSLNYAMPQLDEGSSSQRVLEIVDARHPVIETLLERSLYIGNSVSLRSIGKRGAMLGISGPNMGGKTSLLRTCALMVVMAQIGSFVPATSARLSLFDGVFTVIQRQLWTDTSRRHPAPSFVSTSLRTHELSALSSIAHSATRKSLVVVDEIGFGMASHHARALAVAQAVYFVDSVRCLLLFASHLSDAMEAIKARLGDNCSLKQFVFSSSNDDDEPSEEDRVGDDAGQRVTFHFAITDGIARDALAIDTAKRAGLPRQIIQSAEAAVVRHDSIRESAT